MMETAFLHTEEVRLRAVEPEDLGLLDRMENDESLWQHGNVTCPYSRFQLERYIVENSNDIYTDGQLRLIIELRDGETAGAIDVFSFDPRHRRAELGIVVLKEFRRRGIGRVALSLMERYCFRFLGIHQLYAYIQKENTACLNLFHSSGYDTTGVLKDWLYTSDGYRDVCLLQKLNTLIA